MNGSLLIALLLCRNIAETNCLATLGIPERSEAFDTACRRLKHAKMSSFVGNA